MIFTRQKSRAVENPDSPPRTQSRTNIREVCTPSRKVFTRENNELFIQQVLKYSQDAEGGELHYRVLGLNESSTEDNMKTIYCTLVRQFRPDKNKHSQFSDVMQIINKAKEELEDTFSHNDAMREQECVCMAQNTIVISSDSSSSDDSL